MERVLTLPLYDALLQLCAEGCPLRIVPVTPPKGVTVKRWRVARIVAETDGSATVTVVGEIEGTSGCNRRHE